MRLESGSRIAVIGGGPAGSFFSYFLLDLAERAGIHLSVDIYEPRDFSLPAPKGCNMCAGVISETLVQNLATEGINLPASVVQTPISAYVLHTDLGVQRLEAGSQEKRICAIFRGRGPRGMREVDSSGFDEYLLGLAMRKGAKRIPKRVSGVESRERRLDIRTRDGVREGYDLLAIAAGVNTAALKLFEGGEMKYKPPRTTKTAIREYFLGREAVEKSFGDCLHVFLLDIPRLDFAMIIPKGDYISVCLLGKDIDEGLIRAFLTAPEVKGCFPPEWRWDQPGCHCSPSINVGAAVQPYADRLVFIGDSGVGRLYKDGIGSAYRAAKAAAACAVLEGVSSEDFERYYAPFCRGTERDNKFGRFIFFMARILQRVRFLRKALLQVVAAEQQTPGYSPRISSVLWDAFTGSAPYRDVLLRTLRPAFTGRFVRSLVFSVIGG